MVQFLSDFKARLHGLGVILEQHRGILIRNWKWQIRHEVDSVNCQETSVRKYQEVPMMHPGNTQCCKPPDSFHEFSIIIW